MNDSSGSSGEFQVTGIVRQIDRGDLRSVAESISSFRPSSRYLLFELQVLEVLATSYRGGRPDRSRWTSSVNC